MVRARCHDDARGGEIPLEISECFVRLRGTRLRDLVPAVQQEQEGFRLLYLCEVG